MGKTRDQILSEARKKLEGTNIKINDEVKSNIQILDEKIAKNRVQISKNSESVIPENLENEEIFSFKGFGGKMKVQCTCAKVYDANLSTCPKCGSSQKITKKQNQKNQLGCWGLYSLIILGIFLYGIISVTSIRNQSGVSSSYSSLSWTWEYDGGIRYLSGSVKNTSGRTLSYASIDFNLYDDSGAQVGIALANIANWESGNTWRFKAIVFEDSATVAKCKGITSY